MDEQIVVFIVCVFCSCSSLGTSIGEIMMLVSEW